MKTPHLRKPLLFASLMACAGLIGWVIYSRVAARSSRKPGRVVETGAGEIRVPEGFTLERAAAPDRAHYPMFAVLDDRGRLFVAESSGLNVSGKVMAQHPECRISVLEDVDGDGVYERGQVFADKLSLPMGALWHRGSLYVASPPDFLRLDDADGDGVSERREVILTGWNVLNTASLHGPFLGPDGWLYLTHGRHGYKIQTKEGALLEGLASRLWRCRADGTGLERVAGGGFDNPVELVFSPAGEMLITMTYFTDPNNGQRDALLHLVENGVYPKPHPSVSEFKRTGELMPVMTKFARIAPSGLSRYRGASFGPEFRGNLFSAQFNPHRIQRHVLARDGATFRTEDSDFVTSTDPDFHPTDVLEDADGSLIFLDTGGWYVDACPLSKIHKAERRGGIYRIRKAGAARINDPRGTALGLDSLPPAVLAKHLADPRPAVQDRSLELLAAGGEAAAAALAGVRERATSSEVRCAAVFGLGRVATPEVAPAVRAALSDPDTQVRVSAARVAGMAGDRGAVEQLMRMVEQDELPARRQAATALGQIGDSRAVPALLSAAGTGDRFVEHAVISALIQLKDSAALIAALKGGGPGARQAALVALDQMDDSPLRREHVVPALGDENAELRRAALWVVSHHPDWAGAVTAFLRTRLRAPKFEAEEAEAVREALLAFAADARVQGLVAESLDSHDLGAERQIFLLETIDRCPLKQLPAVWLKSFDRKLRDADARVRARTIALMRSRRVSTSDNELGRIALNRDEPDDLRVAALGALAARNPRLSDPAVEFLLGMLRPEREPALRLSAAQSLGQAKLSRGQLLSLADRYLPSSDSLTLLALLDAFRAADDAAVGQALVAALSQPAVNLEAAGGKRLAQLFQNFPDPVRSAAAPLLARFEAEDAARVRRLRELEPVLTGGGDEGNGRRIFFGKKAACSSCHTIGAEGGHVGPDLTAVGSIRSGHDILEAIVFPSVSFVPGHETRRVATKTSNEVLSGVISEFESTREAVVLVSGPNEKVRIPRDEIISIKPSPVSLMPEGLATHLGTRELADLLAFLKAQK